MHDKLLFFLIKSRGLSRYLYLFKIGNHKYINITVPGMGMWQRNSSSCKIKMFSVGKG